MNEEQAIREYCLRCHHALVMHKFPNGDYGGRCYNLLDGATDATCDCPGFDGSTEVKAALLKERLDKMRELSREIGHLSQQLEAKVTEWFQLSLSIEDEATKEKP
jgi:hypothetical protein